MIIQFPIQRTRAPRPVLVSANGAQLSATLAYLRPADRARQRASRIAAITDKLVDEAMKGIEPWKPEGLPKP